MQFGIFSVSDITRNPVTGQTPSEAERIDAIVRLARRADELYGTSYRLEDFMYGTPLSVGSPQAVIEKTLSFQEGFGDYQRQLWNVDAMGLPLEVALEQVEHLTGTSPYQDTDPDVVADLPLVR